MAVEGMQCAVQGIWTIIHDTKRFIFAILIYNFLNSTIKIDARTKFINSSHSIIVPIPKFSNQFKFIIFNCISHEYRVISLMRSLPRNTTYGKRRAIIGPQAVTCSSTTIFRFSYPSSFPFRSSKQRVPHR